MTRNKSDDRRRAKPESAEDAPKHDQMADREAESRQEALVDEALEETFPSSDPISPKRIT
ncbi:MAG: hypothetical protein GC203_04895 [Phenylobacterium sp.]|uniref:hypothetical protein n=1 Tax=Phenylobacterium sp. TaxID=1871053 RepID=UPI0025F3DB7B|nr:hypothetical protein [Phenylobacterium sp.]MBI1197181.1 hypothetical protein [Phenylobacterium sp.]